MKFSNKIDRLFLLFFVIFSLLIGGVLLRGNNSYPKVIASNVESEVIEPGTNQILLTFNRNMNKASVEKGFKIEPTIPGKFSWIGKKMAYSFNEPLKAGQKIQISLRDAADTAGMLMKQEYRRYHEVSDQTLYFIGAENEQKGRLVRYDVNTKKTEFLSPTNLLIKDFKIQPSGSTAFILGTGVDEADGMKKDLYSLDLQNLSTEKLIDGKKEYIFSMNLSPDGKILLVRKAAFNVVSDYSSLIDPGKLWLYDLESKKWSEFWNAELYGNEFYFSPDSMFLVGRLITGDITIVPIENEPEKVVYLENYSGSYALSPNGTSLIFVDFEDPFSPQQLLLRGNDGNTKILLSNVGQILFPIFNQAGDKLFFLLSKSKSDFTQTGYVELSPYHLFSYDLKENKLMALTESDDFFEGFFSISSDSSLIAFERYKTGSDAAFFDLQLEDEAPAAELWMYNLTNKFLQNLNLTGTKPYLN